MADARPASQSRDDAQVTAQATTARPKLCPDPSADVPHGASLRAIEYQAYVSGLLPGQAIWLNGVSFDGCRQTYGVMLEAVGPNYANFMDASGNWKPWYTGLAEEQGQMRRQSEAAGADGRLVEWHVADVSVANYFLQYARDSGFNNIVVVYDPARSP